MNWTCELFYFFLLYYAFFSPLGHARYDIIVARGQLPQHRHRIASKARCTRYLLYVAYTPCVACTVRLVLMCSILYAQAPSSQTFFVARFLFTYEISTVGPVSYTHLRAHETGRNLVCRLLLEKKKLTRRSNSTSLTYGVRREGL